MSVVGFRVRMSIIALGVAWPAVAQTVSGTVMGSVVDPSGAAVAGAPVALTNEGRGDSRRTVTTENGSFIFLAVPPGTYSLRVDPQGFTSFQRTGIVLNANERLSVGKIELALGAVTATISVAAQGAKVQATSSETSALLTSTQISMIQTRGRDVVSLLRLIPGVSYATEGESVGGQYGISTPNIQGNRSQWNTISVDGVTGMDLADGRTFTSSVNLDAVSEVNVLLNNYQAEYGRNGGALVNIVTKSGTREFHGTAYGYKRHEEFNANSFFNNLNGVSKPLYRYTTLGFTLGGPAYIPKSFNRSRDKLFFFYSLEDWRTKDPRALQRVTVPTELERAGDFSRSLDQNQQLMVVKDPLNGAAFPSNTIPVSRINRNGQKLLGVFPAANVVDRKLTGGNYNYVFQESLEIPKRNHLFRIDYAPTANDKISVRGSTWWSDTQGYTSYQASAWGLIPLHYTYTDNGLMANYTRIFSPSVVNEFSAGVHHTVEKGPPLNQAGLDRVTRSKIGMTLGQFYPQNNAMNIIPLADFGGVPGAASIDLDPRFPLRGADTTISFTETLGVVRGSHSFKFGIYAERLRNYKGERGTFAGNFNFARNVNNPFDSGHPYGNAILGNFGSYVESSSRPATLGRGLTLEWFAQDSWKASRRLTLEYGARFSWYTPWRQKDGRVAAFSLGRYNAATAPLLYRPALDRSGKRAGLNPSTGEIVPAVLIGAFVPGLGDPVDGMVTGTDKDYPQGFKEQQPVQVGPRLGFSYDAFGNGRTAIRGGFGISYNTRPPANTLRMSSTNPPIQFNPTVYYGNLDTFLSSTGVIFPSSVLGFDKNSMTPAVYNFSLGVQHDVGMGTVAEVSYVGALGRHLSQSRGLNKVPYGARFLPQNADSTVPGKPLPDTFFAPYQGYTGITYWENASTSSYHALQIALNRRYAHGLQLGLAYTWSKAMDYTDGTSTEGGMVASFRPIRVWDYGKATFDQTHRLIVNYTWDVPRATRLLPNPLVRHILDNWQLSGVSAFVSGVPSGVGLATVDGADITGGGDGTRVVVTGKAQLARGQRSFARWFDPTVFQRPARGDFGNSAKDVFRGPGVNNWDISLFKKIPFRNERRYLQLRWEMYNAFNHSQFSGVDSNARFDAAGRQVNPRFGQVTGARTPRVMQASLRFAF